LKQRIILLKVLLILLHNYKEVVLMTNPMELSGKKILITGASAGIGRATSILLSELEAQIIMVARREEQLKETLAKLNGKGHSYYCYDLKDINGIENMINIIISDNGSIDGFVHSAGIGNTRPLKMMKHTFVKDVMEINFYSFIEIARCITKKNNYNAGLSMVGISSVSSLQGNQSKTAYCASKAAMDAAIRCMAKELAPKKIRVNSVMPGLIKTDIFDAFLDKGADSEDVKHVMARQYLGIGEPKDVANMVAYLISDASKFITGTSIAVDGGRLSS
jgi:NAD(P)-dependent dehydrogenase (short-subunit alcohol dehydrogenase family)